MPARMPTTPRAIRRAIGTPLVCALLLALAACVIVPYTPDASISHDHADMPAPERTRLSVGPRNFLAGMATTLAKKDRRLQPIDGQAFIDAAAPAGELTLARLLDPATRSRIEPLAGDFLVLFGEPRDSLISNRGGGVLYLGYFGLQKSRTATAIRAAVIDLRAQRLLEKIDAKAEGTDVGVGLFYGLFVVSDTRGGALEGLAGRIVAALAEARPEGPLRVVLLADEPIPTAEEIVARERRERPRPPPRWNVERYPAFAEPGSLAPGKARVFLYRPEDITGMTMPIRMLTGTPPAEREILPLWNGGYFVWDTSPGRASLRVADHPEASVELELAAGASYFVKGRMKMGWSEPRPALEVVDAGKAAKKLHACRRLPAGYPAFEETQRFAREGSAEYQVELAGIFARGAQYEDGRSVPRDEAAAWAWYSIAAASTGSVWNTTAATLRDELAARMTPAQLAAGRQHALDWTPAP